MAFPDSDSGIHCGIARRIPDVGEGFHLIVLPMQVFKNWRVAVKAPCGASLAWWGRLPGSEALSLSPRQEAAGTRACARGRAEDDHFS